MIPPISLLACMSSTLAVGSSNEGFEFGVCEVCAARVEKVFEVSDARVPMALEARLHEAFNGDVAV